MVLRVGNVDHVDSFGNSIGLVKNMFYPIESSIRKVAKDLEQHWRIEKDRRFVVNAPNNVFAGAFWGSKGLVKIDDKKGSGNGFECSQFSVDWSFVMNNFVQAVQKMNVEKSRIVCEVKKKESCDGVVMMCDERLSRKGGQSSSLECLMGFLFDEVARNLQKLGSCDLEKECSNPVSPQFDLLRATTGVFEGNRAAANGNGFLRSLKFARVGGVPSSAVGVSSSPVTEDSDNAVSGDGSLEKNGENSQQHLINELLSIPFSNVEQLRSIFSTASFPSQDHPDRKKLFSVQDFYRYREAEGRRFFEELDRDGDGQVTLEDLEVALNERTLPKQYAHELMRHTRRHLFSKSFGWEQFLSLMEQKEPTILHAYTSLCFGQSKNLQENEILASLRSAGIPASEDNAVAMMQFLNAYREEPISYGHFRNFMVLLPSDQLKRGHRRNQPEPATDVSVSPPEKVPAGHVFKSALAGGISCALSTALMHPIDTVKTRVQASTLSFPQIIAKLPEIGMRGLFKGSVPAILGQFFGHGLRTGFFEASKLLVINIAPTLPYMQVHSTVSFCSAILGTVVRVPSEVLKQRLQADLFDNAGEALIGTWKQDGPKGFFRGTGATLLREVPFYVAGLGLYSEAKKVVQRVLGRELEPWETVVVGAVSGGLTAVLTTPFDVIKTRMMTAPQGKALSMSMVAFSIVRNEGPLVLFKGALPRFFWVAPLGAMNFAGYELLRKAMG